MIGATGARPGHSENISLETRGPLVGRGGKTDMGKLRPGGQMRSDRLFNPASCIMTQLVMEKLYFIHVFSALRVRDSDILWGFTVTDFVGTLLQVYFQLMCFLRIRWDIHFLLLHIPSKQFTMVMICHIAITMMNSWCQRNIVHNATLQTVDMVF